MRPGFPLQKPGRTARDTRPGRAGIPRKLGWVDANELPRSPERVHRFPAQLIAGETGRGVRLPVGRSGVFEHHGRAARPCPATKTSPTELGTGSRKELEPDRERSERSGIPHPLRARGGVDAWICVPVASRARRGVFLFGSGSSSELLFVCLETPTVGSTGGDSVQGPPSCFRFSLSSRCFPCVSGSYVDPGAPEGASGAVPARAILSLLLRNRYNIKGYLPTG